MNKPGKLTPKQKANLKIALSRMVIDHIVCLVAEDNSWLYIEEDMCDKARAMARVDKIGADYGLADYELAANKIDAMVCRELQRESARIIQAVKKLKLKKGA
jgi:hypothetical protein